MTSDLTLFSNLVSAVAQWEDAETPPAELTSAVFEVLQSAVPQARALRLYRVRIGHLRALGATDGAMDPDDTLITQVGDPYHEAIQTGDIVIVTGKASTWLFAPNHTDSPLILLEIDLEPDESLDRDVAFRWVDVIGNALLRTINRYELALWLHRQSQIVRDLAQATRFEEIALALSKNTLTKGQFLTINLLHFDLNGAIAGLRTVASANRHKVRSIDLDIAATPDALDLIFRDVIVDGRIQIIPDVYNADGIDPSAKVTVDGRPIKSAIVFPLRAQGRVLGTIHLNDMNFEMAMSETELDVFQSLADQVGSLAILRSLSEESALTQNISERQARVFNELVAGLDYTDMAQVIARYMLVDSGKLISLGALIFNDDGKIADWEVKALANHERFFEWQADAILHWADLTKPIQNAIMDNELYLIDNVALTDTASLTPGFAAWLARYQVGTFACVPIATGQRPLGVMIIMSRTPNDFIRDEINAYRNICELMGALLDVRRLDEETHASHEAVEQLLLSNRLISTAASPAYMAQAIMYALARGMTGCAITVFDRPILPGEKPLRHHIIGLSTGTDVLEIDPPRETGMMTDSQLERLHSGAAVFLGETITRGLIVEDIAEDLGVSDQNWMALFGLRSGEQLLGTLAVVDSKPIRFEEAFVTAFTSLADQIGLSLRTRQLLDESRRVQELAARLIDAEYAISLADDYTDMGRIILDLVPPEVTAIALTLFDRAATVDELPTYSVLRASVTRDESDMPDIVDPVDPTYPGWHSMVEHLLDGHALTMEDQRERTSSSNPNMVHYYADRGIHSWITVGLRAGRRLLGFLTLTKDVGAVIAEAQLANIRAIADQVAITIENRQLLQRTSESLAEVQTLYITNRELLNAQDKQDVVQVLYQQATPDAVAIVMMEVGYEDVPVSLQFEAVSVGMKMLNPLPTLDTIDPAQTQAFLHEQRNNELLLFISEIDPSSYAARVVEAINARGGALISPPSVVAMPIYDQFRLQHLIFIYYDATIFDESLQRLFNAVRDQVEVVLQNQRLLEEMQMSAGRLLEQVQVLERINQISTMISGTLDQQQLFDVTCSSLQRVLGVDHIGVALYDPTVEKSTVISEHPLTDALGQSFDMTDVLQNRLRTEKRMVYVKDLRAELDLEIPTREFLLGLGINSIMLFPLLDTDNSFLGSIGLDIYRRGYILTQTQIDIAQAIAAQVVVLYQNIRLLDTTRRQADRMEQIAVFGRAVQATLEVEELLYSGIANMRQIVPADYVAVVLYDPIYSRPRRVAWQDADSRLIVSVQGGPFVDLPNTTTGAVWKKQEPLLVEDHASLSAPRFSGSNRVRSSLSVPIFSRGVLRGLVELGSHSARRYDATDRAVLQQIVSQLAVALENAEVYQQSQRLARSKALVNDISTKLQQQVDVEQILSLTVNEIGRALGAKRGRIRLSSDALRSEGQAPLKDESPSGKDQDAGRGEGEG